MVYCRKQRERDMQLQQTKVRTFGFPYSARDTRRNALPGIYHRTLALVLRADPLQSKARAANWSLVTRAVGYRWECTGSHALR